MKPFPLQPELIDVVTVENLPCRVVFKKKLQRVAEISNFWRVDDSWWVKPVTRLYYTLGLESGRRVTVFYDLVDKKWYRQNWTA
jgi:hypothetical protein